MLILPNSYQCSLSKGHHSVQVGDQHAQTKPDGAPSRRATRLCCQAYVRLLKLIGIPTPASQTDDISDATSLIRCPRWESLSFRQHEALILNHHNLPPGLLPDRGPQRMKIPWRESLPSFGAGGLRSSTGSRKRDRRRTSGPGLQNETIRSGGIACASLYHLGCQRRR